MSEVTPLTIGGTDEVRALIEAGQVFPGDPAVDRPVSSMSDRELAEETVILLRRQRDVVTGVMADLMNSPLGAMMSGQSSPFAAMFGRSKGV
jgi:hypothetical protein